MFGTVVILGLILVLQSPKLWIALVVLIPIQILRAPQEAKVLEEKFGNECREYNGEARQTFPSLLRRCKLRSSTTTRCALYQGVSVSETKTWIVARLGCSF